jgi:hypothetical protein
MMDTKKGDARRKGTPIGNDQRIIEFWSPIMAKDFAR